MAQFDLENYVTVNDRIAEFWKKRVAGPQGNGKGRIVTQLVHIDPPETANRMAVVLAQVFLGEDPIPAATGLAKEREGTGGMANKTAFLENCETSAIGRALANLGILTEKNRPSREEMEAVERAESEHASVLERLKTIARGGSDEVKNRVKEKWGAVKVNPIAALELLNSIEGVVEVE